MGPNPLWWIPALALCAVGWVLWDDRRLTVSRYRLKSAKLTAPVRIVQLSDLHNRRFGRENRRLTRAVRDERPDAVVMTGDLMDRRKPYDEGSVRFLTGLARFAPVFFVYGNHEMRGGFGRRLADDLGAGGVQVLDNRQVTVTLRGQTVSLLGLNEYGARRSLPPYADGRRRLRRFESTPGLKVVLSHYPHYFAGYRKACQYSRYDVDLVMAGHAHGGLIRLPFLPGAAAPGQGLFPRYTAGLYRARGTSMLVSRGLGDSGLPRRVGNPPELVVLDLLPAGAAGQNAPG